MAWIWFPVAFLCIAGLLGTFIPLLPGVGIIFLGILLYAIVTDFVTISPFILSIFALTTVLASLSSYGAGIIGARVGGGGRLTVLGAIIGAVVGVLVTPLGLLLGSFVGALAGALIESPDQTRALRVSLFTVIGVVGSSILQFMIGLSMIAAFIMLVLVG